MKKCIINILKNKYFLVISGILLFFLIWEIVSLIINEPIMIFPDPFTTIGKAFEFLGKEYTWKCILGSLKKIGLGFLYAFTAALLLGIIAGNSKYIQQLFHPTMVALKAIPTAAMVFVFLVLVGFNDAPILIVVLMAFPILYESVIAGFNNINDDIMDALKIDRVCTLKKVLGVKLPLSLPYIVVGLASSFALTFKVEIMAEIMTGGSDYGLGTIIQLERTYYHTSDMRPVFGYAFIAIMIALLMSYLAYFLKKKLLKNVETKKTT